jgi:nickel-dependent lactate racemase
LLIVPDQTRTAPLGLIFRAFCELWLKSAAQIDVMVALGTHPAMSEKAILQRLEISRQERFTTYGKVCLFNHVWDNPAELKTVGHLTRDMVSEMTDGLFSLDVEVTINRKIFDYDEVVIMGPVYPHEVVGFSGVISIYFLEFLGRKSSTFFIGWAPLLPVRLLLEKRILRFGRLWIVLHVLFRCKNGVCVW